MEEALAKEKEVAVLRERNRMAREMHDVLGHALVLVAVKIEAAQRLQAVDPVRATAELDATKELVRQSMTDLRVSLADLRSPALEADDQPLTQALGDGRSGRRRRAGSRWTVASSRGWRRCLRRSRMHCGGWGARRS